VSWATEPARAAATPCMVSIPPVTSEAGWVSWEEPDRYALVCPCAGTLADHRARPAPASQAALLGPARASVLCSRTAAGGVLVEAQNRDDTYRS